MHSACVREASQSCFHGCCPSAIFLDSNSLKPAGTKASQHEFVVATASSIYPQTRFTNHESLPSLQESFSNFRRAFPQYCQTDETDRIRAQEYYHLSFTKHVCLDYIGHGLFSYSQLQSHCESAPIASSSKSPPSLGSAFFDISYKPVNLNAQIKYGGQETELESKIQKRIMAFMNISGDDYTMVFTANHSSAFKLLADFYPFESNRNLLTVYDYETDAVEAMVESTKKRGARVMSAEFSWPNLKIQSEKLRRKLESKTKKRKKGLFVFPLQSRMTGARYSYKWLNMAQENGWHVLLDASALGPKNMDTLGLSLFQPDFLICSFYKVFGDNPSGFGCLFVKKSSASVLMDSTAATSVGLATLLPVPKPSQYPEESVTSDIKTKEKSELDKDTMFQPEVPESEEKNAKKKALTISEIEELEDKPFASFQSKTIETTTGGNTELECRGLDHADSLGLILISSRARYLINWLINALMNLQHPNSENGLTPVRIYGPKVKFDRGPALAFNIYDWKGEKIDPALVQKLADRNNISLSCGFLCNIFFSEKYLEEKEQFFEKKTTESAKAVLYKKRNKSCSRISVVTVAMGLLTNFEDTYRLWEFVSKFLDADFVEKERWRYTALNQKTIEV